MPSRCTIAIQVKGVRVYLDAKKQDMEKYPVLSAWFLRDKSHKGKDDKEKASKDFITRVGREILSYRKVKIKLPTKERLYFLKLCKIM